MQLSQFGEFESCIVGVIRPSIGLDLETSDEFFFSFHRILALTSLHPSTTSQESEENKSRMVFGPP